MRSSFTAGTLSVQSTKQCAAPFFSRVPPGQRFFLGSGRDIKRPATTVRAYDPNGQFNAKLFHLLTTNRTNTFPSFNFNIRHQIIRRTATFLLGFRNLLLEPQKQGQDDIFLSVKARVMLQTIFLVLTMQLWADSDVVFSCHLHLSICSSGHWFAALWLYYISSSCFPGVCAT